MNVSRTNSPASADERDEDFKARRCGSSADEFDDVYQIMRWSCATPALAVHFAREGKTYAEAQRRLKELN